MSILRVVTTHDRDRAEAIELWRNRFSVATTRTTMWSALVSVARLIHDVPRTAPIDTASVEWEVFSDLLAFEWLLRVVEDAVNPATARKYQSAVTSLLRYMAATGFANSGALDATLTAIRRRRRQQSEQMPALLSTSDLAAILSACRCDPSRIVGMRDAALIAMAAGTRARRAEVVRLTAADFDRESRLVRFPITKGGGARTTVLAARAVPDVEAWCTHFAPAPEMPLFPSLRKGGGIGIEAMSSHQFWKRVKIRAAQAGVVSAVSPHDFRRWYVTSLLDAGNDIFTVMRAVGHRQPATTQKYDRRPVERLRSVIDSLEVGGV